MSVQRGDRFCHTPYLSALHGYAAANRFVFGERYRRTEDRGKEREGHLNCQHFMVVLIGLFFIQREGTETETETETDTEKEAEE